MLKFFRTIRKKLIEQENVRKYLLYRGPLFKLGNYFGYYA